MSSWVIDVIESLGYTGLFALMAAECVFPPIPSEAILPFAGFLVADGRMSFPLALGAATAGSLAGNVFLYVLARRGGRPLVERHGARLGCPPPRLITLERWFDRWGWLALFAGRGIPLVRSAISVPAGLARYPFGRFVALTAAGSATWNAALLGAGWALNDAWHQVTDVVGPLSIVVVLLLIAATGVLVLRHRRRRGAGVLPG